MKAKRRNDSLNNQQDLEAVLLQFARWRAERKTGERIPQQLWQAAASLHPRYSVYQIARALRLDFLDLRDHIHPYRKKGGSKREGSLQFMQLPIAPAEGLADCRLKVSEGRRVRLLIRLKAAGVGPVVELLREVWSRGA